MSGGKNAIEIKLSILQSSVQYQNLKKERNTTITISD